MERVELARVAAGEIGARGAVVGHEQRVADEDRVADPVGDAAGVWPGDVDHLGLQPADAKRSPSREEPVELRAVAGHVLDVEDRAEDASARP